MLEGLGRDPTMPKDEDNEGDTALFRVSGFRVLGLGFLNPIAL